MTFLHGAQNFKVTSLNTALHYTVLLYKHVSYMTYNNTDQWQTK